MDRAQMTIFEVAEPWAKPRLPGVDERINERLQEASDRLGTAKWFTGSFSAGDLLMVSVLRIIAGEGLVEAYQLPLLSKSDLACRLATSAARAARSPRGAGRRRTPNRRRALACAPSFGARRTAAA